MALEIRSAVEPIVHRDDGKAVGREQRAHFVFRPDVELALFAFAVGVEAREEAAIRRAHLPGHPADDAVRHVREPRVAGRPREVGIEREQRTVVVEHLFEMRNRPLGVDAVAAEAAAQLIVDAAVGHPQERDAHHRERGRRLRCARARRGKARDPSRAETWARAPNPPWSGSNRRLSSDSAAVEALRRQRVGARGRGLEARERVLQIFRLPRDVGAALAVRGGHARQEIAKAGQAVAPLLREIGAAEERRPLGREEHRQRPPAAAPREERVRGLVDLVEIGPLLAIDLDVDEIGVHRRGDRRILERFVRHHVAPVARRVADRQQDRLSFARARAASASSSHGCQSTGFAACCSRYGLVSPARRFGTGSCAARRRGGQARSSLRTRRARSRHRDEAGASGGTAGRGRRRASAAPGSD